MMSGHLLSGDRLSLCLSWGWGRGGRKQLFLSGRYPCWSQDRAVTGRPGFAPWPCTPWGSDVQGSHPASAVPGCVASLTGSFSSGLGVGPCGCGLLVQWPCLNAAPQWLAAMRRGKSLLEMQEPSQAPTRERLWPQGLSSVRAELGVWAPREPFWLEPPGRTSPT